MVVRMFGLHSGDSSMVHLLTEELSEFGAAAWDPLQVVVVGLVVHVGLVRIEGLV